MMFHMYSDSCWNQDITVLMFFGEFNHLVGLGVEDKSVFIIQVVIIFTPPVWNHAVPSGNVT